MPLHIGAYDVSFTNQALWMFIVVGAASLLLYLAPQCAAALCRSRMQSMAELSYEFVANMIRSAAGEAGLAFLPLRLHDLHVRAVVEFLRSDSGVVHGHEPDRSDLCARRGVILTVIVTGFRITASAS